MVSIKKALAVVAVSLISVNSFAAECDSEFVAHSESVSKMVTSGDPYIQSIGEAQRDCLAVELYPLDAGSDFCPTFRDFQTKFLVLPDAEQITKGLECKKSLLDHYMANQKPSTSKQ